MKSLKLSVLVASAALAIAAFLGAAPASANYLCKVPGVENTCPTEQRYPVGTEVIAQQTGLSTWTTDSGSIYQQCEAGKLALTLTDEGGPGWLDYVVGENTQFSLTGCTYINTVTALGTTSFASGLNGKDGGATQQGVSLTQKSYPCVLGGFGEGAKATAMSVTGGNPATISVNTNVRVLSGACTERHVVASYAITSPSSLYITKH